MSAALVVLCPMRSISSRRFAPASAVSMSEAIPVPVRTCRGVQPTDQHKPIHLRFNTTVTNDDASVTNDDETSKRHLFQTIRPYLYAYLRAVSVVLGGIVGVPGTKFLDDYIAKRFGPPQAPLAVRAQEVTDALTRVGELLDELQAEVQARMTLIESLAGKAQDAEQRATDALRRANLSEEDAKAVDAYLNRALTVQLSEVEGKARRREWGLGTIGGLVVGIAAILIGHFLFGL